MGLAAGVAGDIACSPERNMDSGKTARETNDSMSAVSKPNSTVVAAQKSGRTPVVLFFGTSLTAGYGLSPEQAFPSLIEKIADSANLPIRAVNAGLSGETTAGAVRRIDWALRTPADVVVIEAGANDALRGLSPDAARANLQRVITAVRTKQPNARIVLVQMEAPPNYGPAYTKSFRAVYTDLAKKENIPLVPFLLNGVAGIARLNQPDGVHPNLAGERIVAENVWRGIRPVVEQLDRAAVSG
jgi:acyl-CoA thioesterase-1